MRALIYIVASVLFIIFLFLTSVVYRFHHHVKSDNKEIIRGPFKVIELNSFLTPAECDEIIEIARESGNMKVAETLDTGNDTLSSYSPDKRSSKTVFLPDSSSPIIEKIAEYFADWTGLPIENQEQIQVASYDAEGKFDDHYDACDSSPEVCERFNRGSGHRVATMLIYLNDDYEGGHTVFGKVDPVIDIRPRIGKAILFEDSLDEEIILESMHRGEQVSKGNKWICTKWVHSKKWNG